MSANIYILQTMKKYTCGRLYSNNTITHKGATADDAPG